jgi:hypothetical protein
MSPPLSRLTCVQVLVLADQVGQHGNWENVGVARLRVHPKLHMPYAVRVRPIMRHSDAT